MQPFTYPIYSEELETGFTVPYRFKEIFNNNAYAFSVAIDVKSPWTSGHSQRVAHYAFLTAEELNLEENFKSELKVAALLHDIGKIGVPDSILNKPAPLTNEEWTKMKKHPLIGAEIAGKTEQIDTVVSGIRQHHERIDGKGYPDGIAGDQISLVAKIISVADSFDAMTNDRPYRSGMSKEDTFGIMERDAGEQWDSEIVKVFIKALSNIEINSDINDGERKMEKEEQNLDWIPLAIESKPTVVTDTELEKRIYQSQKMETLGELVNGVAHDFKNILASIEGYTYLLKSQIDEVHPFYNSIKRIEEASQQASELTHQLLTFAHNEEIDINVVDLNNVIQKVSKLLKGELRLIDIETNLDENLCCVEGNFGQLKRVLLNLLINARDAMPDGGKITIETLNINLSEKDAQKLKLEAGDYVLMQISDTGLGMSPKVQKMIFEPFFSTKKDGTGMGLAIVKDIIRKHNGMIDVSSSLGEGSTFSVYLPALEGRIL
jgi:putative nucleotidyltransferase with HDIG domain